MLSFLQKFQDLGGMALLGTLARGFNDFEVDFILQTSAGTWLEWRSIHTCPMRAIVKPANTPPSKTRIAAPAKYNHSVRLSGDRGGSSSAFAVEISRTGMELVCGRLNSIISTL